MKSRLKRRTGPVWLPTLRGRYEATMPDGYKLKVCPFGSWWLAGRQLARRADGFPGATVWHVARSRSPGCSLRRSAMLLALDMWNEKKGKQ